LLYATYKFVHILGVVFLIGNVSVTSVWKVFADRTGNPSIVAFAQRLVIHTDWTLTGGGILLTLLGGYGMTSEANISLLQIPWLLWSQVFFVVSGVIWLVVLIPIQIAQSRLAKVFDISGISAKYRRHARAWIQWGVVATIPLIVALYLMVEKII